MKFLSSAQLSLTGKQGACVRKNNTGYIISNLQHYCATDLTTTKYFDISAQSYIPYFHQKSSDYVLRARINHEPLLDNLIRLRCSTSSSSLILKAIYQITIQRRTYLRVPDDRLEQMLSPLYQNP